MRWSHCCPFTGGSELLVDKLGIPKILGCKLGWWAAPARMAAPAYPVCCRGLVLVTVEVSNDEEEFAQGCVPLFCPGQATMAELLPCCWEAAARGQGDHAAVNGSGRYIHCPPEVLRDCIREGTTAWAVVEERPQVERPLPLLCQPLLRPRPPAPEVPVSFPWSP